MRVEIRHQHAPRAARQQVARRDGNVVEQAKSHRPRGFGVMPGRADERERVGGLTRPDRARPAQGPARSEQGVVK